VADVLTPRHAVAFDVDLDQREVGHETCWRCAVPVILPGVEEHAVAGADGLDRAAAPLDEPGAFGDIDGLAVRVGVPRGAGARREVDAARAEAGGTRWRRDRVDV